MNTDTNSPIKVGVLIYTYNRVDDARINMEIIRNVWSINPLLKDAPIVHAFNGKKEWWPKPYLEDRLVRTENPGHFSGAALLLNTGMETFAKEYPDVTHVIVLASDTWCVKPEYIDTVIQEMNSDDLYLATCAWGTKKESNMFEIGMALDFFIVQKKFSITQKLFPIRYQEFAEKYEELLSYQGSNVFPERVFALRFKQAIVRAITIPSENLITDVATAHIRRMTEREPVHHDKKVLFHKPKNVRRMYWPKVGLITHHDPKEKQEALKQYNLALGEHGTRFLETTDLSYFNNGLTRTAYIKDGKEIGYID
jgi:hypothetical protein